MLQYIATFPYNFFLIANSLEPNLLNDILVIPSQNYIYKDLFVY